MSRINELLDAAERVTGSDYKTAQLLGKPRQEISNWRHGHKKRSQKITRWWLQLPVWTPKRLWSTL